MHMLEQVTQAEGIINYANSVLANELEPWERKEYQALVDDNTAKLADLNNKIKFANEKFGEGNW